MAHNVDAQRENGYKLKPPPLTEHHTSSRGGQSAGWYRLKCDYYNCRHYKHFVNICTGCPVISGSCIPPPVCPLFLSSSSSCCYLFLYSVLLNYYGIKW